MRTLQVVFYLCAAFVLASANHEKFNHRNHPSNSHLKREERASPSEPPICIWNCVETPANNSQHTLEITNKAKEKLLAIYSEFTKIALVKDYTNNIAAIYNGSSGEVAVSDLKNQCHYHVEHTNVHSWTSSASSWHAFFAKLTSLAPLLKYAKQHPIVECAPDDHTPVFAAIARGYISLGSFLPPKETLQMLVELTEHLQGPYGAVYSNSSSFSIQNNLEWFLKVNLAIARVFKDGNVTPNLKKANFNLKLIFGTNSGFEGFLNFLIQIGPHCDIFHVTLPLMSNEERMLQLLLHLSGGNDKGIDGLIDIITKIVIFMHGRGNINDVITAIINYKPDGADIRLTKLINRFLKFVESQQRLHSVPPQFRLFIQFLKAINQNNLILNGVNISDIIKLLRFYHPSETIPTIIKILSRFSPSRGIPQFFRFIVGVLNGTQDPSFITRLIPGINLAHFNGSGNILQQILHGQNFTQLFQGGVSGLSHIPIFGQIFKSIQSGLPTTNISHFLNPAHVFHDIQHVFGSGAHEFFSGIAHGIETIFGGGGGGSNNSSSGGVLSGFSNFFSDGSGSGSTERSTGSDDDE